jgi:hypothetical protein
LVTTYDIFRFSSKEDRLTAQLVYTMKSTNYFLREFLKLCGELDIPNLEKISSQLQVVEDESRPDVVIKDGSEQILYIESKPFQKASAHQLVQHVNSGKELVPVICITGERGFPKEVKQAQEILKEQGCQRDLIRWISWKDIYYTLKSLPEDVLSKPEVMGMIESLQSENLAGFLGYKNGELRTATEFVQRYKETVKKTERLMQDVTNFLEQKNSNIITSSYHPTKEHYCIHIFYFRGWKTCGETWQESIGSFAGIKNDFENGRFEIYARIGLETIRKHCDSDEKFSKMLDDIEKAFTDKFGSRTLFAPIGETLECYILYSFNDDSLYLNPEKVVEKFSNDVFWILKFLQERRLYD